MCKLPGTPRCDVHRLGSPCEPGLQNRGGGNRCTDRAVLSLAQNQPMVDQCSHDIPTPSVKVLSLHATVWCIEVLHVLAENDGDTTGGHHSDLCDDHRHKLGRHGVVGEIEQPQIALILPAILGMQPCEEVSQSASPLWADGGLIPPPEAAKTLGLSREKPKHPSPLCDSDLNESEVEVMRLWSQ